MAIDRAARKIAADKRWQLALARQKEKRRVAKLEREAKQLAAGKSTSRQGQGGGGPFGNQHHTKGRVWRGAINAALARRSKGKQISELEKVAEALIDAAKAQDVAAIKELGDRIDGKVPQAITGDGANPILFADINQMSDEELEKLARSN